MVADDTEEVCFFRGCKNEVLPAAVQLSLACHQIHEEMHVLPYSKLPIMVYSFTTFYAWLCKRTQAQRNAITRIDMRSLVMLDGLQDHHVFKLVELPPVEFDHWPKLPNLVHVHVYHAPYDRLGNIDPRDPENQVLWHYRAQIAAKVIARDPRALTDNEELEITGEWEDVGDEMERANHAHIVAKYGYVWDDVGRRWVLCLPAPGKM